MLDESMETYDENEHDTTTTTDIESENKVEVGPLMRAPIEAVISRGQRQK